jgi:hypothetical protein
MLALLIALTQSAHAAPPDGSYRQTCRLIIARPGNLTAWCQTSQGDWMRSLMLDWERCPADIANLNGVLTCDIPPLDGSYQRTCVEILRRGADLDATCQHIDGRWSRSRLINATLCVGDIANIDGVLTCMP